MEPKTLLLAGKPRAKARPRFSRRKTYDPQAEDAQTDRWRLKAQMHGPPLEGPLSVSAVFVFKRPKSWPKKRKDTFHSSRPDLDNLVKWICDAGNCAIWHDDAQIVCTTAIKIYGEEEKTIITVTRAKGE